MTKSIVLCADDYGQAPNISRGIIDLLEKERLSATSCMVTSLNWPEQGGWLKSFENKADLGLHFNLTQGKPLSLAFTNTYGDSFFSLPILMARSLAGFLDKEVIQAECQAQIDQFKQVMGFFPHFIDGHQHIHQFPVIREGVLGAYMSCLKEQGAYTRVVNPTAHAANFFNDFKKMIIYQMGANQWETLIEREQIPHNSNFEGIYAFKGPYRPHFRGFLAEIKDKGIIMCHPGLENSEDPIGKARWLEYQYLASPEFLSDCEHFGVKIGRFKPL